MSHQGKNKDFSSILMAGNVANRVKHWRRISSDPWLISTIQGVEIPFVQLPVQTREQRPYKLSVEECAFVDKELVRMLERGIVETAEPRPDHVVSNIFLRPKKDGTFRLILDLTWVNDHIQYEHFKMHSLNTALEMMRPNCWMGSVDLKDAYYSIPIKQEFRKFLRFRWEEELYQFTVLPNGLACAPRIFTKVLNPVFAQLRELGHECFQYIDDSFVVADSWDKCEESVRTLSNTLEDLGFVVHKEKSIVTPTREITFLGFLLDSTVSKVFLTEDKEEKLLRAAGDVLKKAASSIREVAGLIGLCIAYMQAFRYGEKYVKQLEMEKIEALRLAKGNFDSKMILTDRAREDIVWWTQNVRYSGKDILYPEPDLVLFTDASTEGWGAHVEGQAVGGCWSEQEAQSHINVLELKAIDFGLRSLCNKEGIHVKVFTDNTTALAYVKHQGGVKSPECNEVAQDIWLWCENREMWLSVAHIPGVDNEIADYKSRNFADNPEWGLKQDIFDTIVRVFGKPEIDLFATRLNAKLDKYVSWKPDPFAYAIDAFSLKWSNSFFYAFPPFSCIGRSIRKILDEGAKGVLVVPWWTGQPWWGRLVSLKLRRLQFRQKKGNLIPQGVPENETFLSRCPLGAFLF